MQLIDTHVHINFDVFQEDLEQISSRWREAGVIKLVHSCVTPDDFPSIKALADKFPELSFSVGLHPLDAEKWREHETDKQIKTLATSDCRVVALGEMGLDFYKAENKAQQERVFLSQLTIARELGLPVIIHCRDAAPTLCAMIKDFGAGTIKGVMHCWAGNVEETKWFLDLGFYISFSGVVTFKNAKQVQESAKIVPSESLLIETDCPFLAPGHHRGKRNEPAFVRHVAEYLSHLRNEPLETLAAQTTANACQLFKL